jgi:hypothetical protein
MDGWEFRSPNSKFPAVHREEHRSNPSSYKVCVNDDMPCILKQTQTRPWAMAAERYLCTRHAVRVRLSLPWWADGAHSTSAWHLLSLWAMETAYHSEHQSVPYRAHTAGGFIRFHVLTTFRQWLHEHVC